MSDEFLDVPPTDSAPPPPPPPPASPAPDPVGVTDDDKLWALLAYVLSPLMPVIIMFMDDKKNRPYLRSHNAQALVVGLVNLLAALTISWLTCGLLSIVIFIFQIYWGMQAYNGKTVEIPVISKFCRDQGWA
ncbi:MAG TPA: hypothetical protein PK299_07390 [Anaerolineales bacterium]|nr:hypothetical protein [Anaerolineales bacterium]